MGKATNSVMGLKSRELNWNKLDGLRTKEKPTGGRPEGRSQDAKTSSATWDETKTIRFFNVRPCQLTFRRTLRSSMFILKHTSSLQMLNSALIESSNFVVSPSPDSQYVRHRFFLTRLHIWHHFAAPKRISYLKWGSAAGHFLSLAHIVCAIRW